MYIAHQYGFNNQWHQFYLHGPQRYSYVQALYA